MLRGEKRSTSRRVDMQVFLFTAVVVVLSCTAIFSFCYHLTYDSMIESLICRVESIHNYVETFLTSDSFTDINGPEDTGGELYRSLQAKFRTIKETTDVRYLYTAKETETGVFVYVLDGLDPAAADFRQPGDPIEPEIVPEMRRAMAGEAVLPRAIKDTGWGKIFITYLPVHAGGAVIGVVGIEFEAEDQYDTYRTLRLATPCVITLACLLSALFAIMFFRRISNPTYRDLSNTDQLTGLKNRNAFEIDLKNAGRLWKTERNGVVVADLNDLKQINDTLGHQAGDFYLQAAAQAIRETAGRAVAYRVGGDEFVLLTGDMTLPEMEDSARRFQRRLLELKPREWDMDIGFSSGCALFLPGTDQDLSATYRRADQAMYREKQRHHMSKQDKEKD